MSDRILKTLLLNSSFEILQFISHKKAFKLLIKEKVEIIGNWDEDINWGPIVIKHPAILRLKNHVKRSYFNSNFSRKALIKRDRGHCQYCNTKLTAAEITVDHVLPRAQGGVTSFTNCVVCCYFCNNQKADRTPEQAGMPLLKRPTHPSFSSHYYAADAQEHYHPDWSDYMA